MNRIMAVLVMMAALCGVAQANTREDVLSGIARCGAIADDHTWLNCIYGAAQPMRGQLGLPPAPASQTALVPAPSPTAPHFAVTAPQSPPKEENHFLAFVLGGDAVVRDMPLESYRFNSDGMFDVTLANGQVWEQRGGPTPHWHGPASRYVASITKGAVGSYNLVIANEGVQYKVLRLR